MLRRCCQCVAQVGRSLSTRVRGIGRVHRIRSKATNTSPRLTQSLFPSRAMSTAAVSEKTAFDWDAIEREKGSGWPTWLAAELRSDHAGETGAVYIYKGALWAMQVRGTTSRLLYNNLGVDVGCPYREIESQPAWQFANEHVATESQHLDLMERLVPPQQRSSLIPLWKVAGFALGALPTFAGRTPRWLYFTVEAVETFVEEHYLNHIVPLEAKEDPSVDAPELTRLLRHCCEEEVHHRDDAAARAGLAPGESKPFLVRVWFSIVAGGSQAAVELAKRV